MSCNTPLQPPDLFSKQQGKALQAGDGPPVRKPLLFSPGNVSAPAVASEEDKRTGFYWPALNTLAVAVNGLLRWWWDATGFGAVFGRWSATFSANLTANRSYTFPDESGELMVRPAPATAENSMTVEIDDSTGPATEAVAENLARSGGWVTNNGPEDCWISPNPDVTPGNVASATGGSKLDVHGTWPLDRQWKGAWYAVCATGKTTILGVIELES